MLLWQAEKNLEAVLDGLASLGYRQSLDLLERDYAFVDYLTLGHPRRRVAAAAFGQTPTSYESALIGVVCPNGTSGKQLVNEYRGLGAPFMLEVGGDRVTEWAVSRHRDKHEIIQEYPGDRISQLFVSRAPFWRPETLLRAKNIGDFTWIKQRNLFSGLLPELEDEIQESLDPLLRGALGFAKRTYKESTGHDADPDKLFKIIFFLLTAKVFHDRGVNGFRSISPDADTLLDAVGKQYKIDIPQLLNRETREAAASHIWDSMDFRNLSVEILAEIWSTTLVDASTRKKLGIHRTSRTIVKYIVDRIPFQHWGNDRRIVFEPCCGSAVFLIGAMNHLRQQLFGPSAADRHSYFVRHLVGLERDPFGVEISRLSLTLADFPNPGGWKVDQADVFSRGAMSAYLQQAGVVLCNPPFEDFDRGERSQIRYSLKKPVELLNLILDDLHVSGVLGFVLPRNFVDGRGYSEIRARIARRFAEVELTILPDRAFKAADSEVALLIAREPIPHHTSKVGYLRVEDGRKEWESFVSSHRVSIRESARMSPKEAADTFAVPEVGEVWETLINHHGLKDVAVLGRGLEWNKALTVRGQETGNREALVRSSSGSGFIIGVPPRAKFAQFEVPPLKYLSVREEDRRGNAYGLPWRRPKVILNKSARSRGPWRIAGFPDAHGVACYQTFTAVWPNAGWDVWTLSAVLNGPVANAFVSTREGKTDNSMEVLKRIPMPYLTSEESQAIRSLVTEYQRVIAPPSSAASEEAGHLLLRIDASVLAGYHMPPRVERELLDRFRNKPRPVGHPFGEYFPPDLEVYFSLSDYLSPAFKDGTAGELLKRLAMVQPQ